MSLPNAATRLAGVVGHPVSHSLSPVLHNAVMRHEGRNAVYLAFDVVPADFKPFVAGMRAAGVRGLNVTLPHKGEAFECAGALGEEAQATHAVNTLVFDEGAIAGHNTDVAGVRRALQELGAGPGTGSVLVIGAGGAARAAAWAVAEAPEILIVNRTGSRAEELAEGLGPQARAVAWEKLPEAATEVKVIIHTTSLGLDGRGSALDLRSLERAAAAGCSTVLDLVYGVQETPLVRMARAAGVKAADGLAVLVHQAAEAYRLMWGSAPDLEVMWEAAARPPGRAPDGSGVESGPAPAT